MKYKALTLILSLALPSLALAWHNEGHQTVAAIAWDQMTPQARTKAMALLKSAPQNTRIATFRPTTGTAAERDRMQFIRVATWADAMRGTQFDHPDWHFADLFWEQQQPGGPKKQRPDMGVHGEMITRLPALEASLRNPNGATVSGGKATDLAWMLHLMGDIAQPLHASGRITALDPQGDQGGNHFCLTKPDKNGKSKNNLHAYWDDVIEREFGKPADIVKVAAGFEKTVPRSLGLGNYKGWASASQKIAFDSAYPAALVRNQAPPAAYRDLVKRTSQKAITLGGFRLGATLNSVFAH